MTIGRRVLVLTQYYAPESGATAVRLSAMTRELVKLGFDVRVLTGLPNYPTGRVYDGYRGTRTMSETIDGIPVRRVWLYPASGRGAMKRLANYLSFTVTASLALLTHGGRRHTDLVFVEAQPITLALPALMNKVFRRVPYVYNTPDLQVEYAAEDRWGVRAIVASAGRLEGWLMKHALSVTTVTYGFIEHFSRVKRLPISHFTFLPNGADTETLQPSPRDEDLATTLGVPDKKIFTFAGTHAPYQGIEVILEAAKLLGDRQDIAIFLVGDGPVRKQLMDQAAREHIDNVYFRTSPFSEMKQLMSITQASLVVLRPLGISKIMRLSKAIPPLACGTPVIYAGWGETAKIIQAEGVGIVVEPDDPAALAAAIKRMADDPAECDQMGVRGRSLAEREFSWSTIVADWVRQMDATASGRDPDVPGLKEFL